MTILPVKALLPAPPICSKEGGFEKARDLAPASVGALFLAEDAMQKDQSWLSGLVPA